jgi:hypothetical protein
MKTLIENTIKIWYSGKGPNLKTIFNSIDTDSAKYYDVSALCGKKTVFEYLYEQDSATKTGHLTCEVPEGLTEIGVRDWAISEIRASLGE